jgi:probable F420-dependent oxidoreductase
MRAVAPAAEELGYESLWLNEFLATEPSVLARFDDPPDYYDPIVVVAALAELTKRIRFFTSTIVLPLHEPALLAKQVATIDVFSGGRLTLGIGLGGPAEEYKRLRGEIDAPNRGQMLDEYVPAMRTLWADRRATFKGKYVAFEDLEMFPKPIQDPVPIYMAGTADGVYRRIAAHGQGWIDTFLLPDAIATARSTIESYWSDAGRAGQPEVARQFYLSIAEKEADARDNFDRSLPRARPASPPPPDYEMTLVGTPRQISDRISTYVAAGVTEVCAIFYAPDVSATIRQMELFATSVVPELRAA